MKKLILLFLLFTSTAFAQAPLDVYKGGQGRNYLDSLRILLGKGRQPVISLAAGTDSMFLMSRGAGIFPVWSYIDLVHSVTGILDTNHGGTSANTANGALNNLLPSQTGDSGKFLMTDGINTLWQFIPGTANSSISIGDTVKNSTNYRLLIVDGSHHLGEITNSTSGRVLRSNGTGAAPSYSTLSSLGAVVKSPVSVDENMIRPIVTGSVSPLQLMTGGSGSTADAFSVHKYDSTMLFRIDTGIGVHVGKDLYLHSGVALNFTDVDNPLGLFDGVSLNYGNPNQVLISQGSGTTPKWQDVDSLISGGVDTTYPYTWLANHTFQLRDSTTPNIHIIDSATTSKGITLENLLNGGSSGNPWSPAIDFISNGYNTDDFTQNRIDWRMQTAGGGDNSPGETKFSLNSLINGTQQTNFSIGSTNNLGHSGSNIGFLSFELVPRSNATYIEVSGASGRSAGFTPLFFLFINTHYGIQFISMNDTITSIDNHFTFPPGNGLPGQVLVSDGGPSGLTHWDSVGSASGIGTVTSVAASGGTTGLSFTGSPITTSGTLTQAGTLNETHGGTNQTSYTTGDITYASASNTISKRAIGSSGDVLTVSGGVPVWSAPTTGTMSRITLSGLDATATSAGTIGLATGDFIVIAVIVRLTAANTITVQPTISIGTNSPNWDNLAAPATANLNNVNDVNYGGPAGGIFSLDQLALFIPSGTLIKYNITGAATATTMTLAIDIIGYYL